MNQPEPQSRSFDSIINDIERGKIKIPQFQREFVWPRSKSAALLDSILKGYPIGTFILWRTREELRSIRNIGNAELPETPSGDYAQQVLDGQQRLTSLYACVRGLSVQRDGKTVDFAKIFVDLEADAGGDEPIVVTDLTNVDDRRHIRVVDLLQGTLSYFTRFPEQLHVKLDQYRKRLTSYSFSVILVQDAPIDVATEIFTRINVQGQRLSVFEIMVAKTFSPRRDFDLAEKYEDLLDDLRQVDYGTIPSAVILQCVAAILTKLVGKAEVLRLDKTAFIDAWPSTVDGVHRAVDFFRTVYRIPVSGLLPYPALLVPFSYFFHKHPDRPKGEQKNQLQDFFWRVCLTSRYSGSSQSLLEQDLSRIDSILDGKLPKYDEGVDTSVDFITDNGTFRAGRAYIKALLCLLAYQRPKSFEDESDIRISNDWLKRANSRNYHHFFPRSFLRKKEYADWYANHIVNITIVDDYLNKARIRDKPPATYMKSFKRTNPNLAKTMKTHLISLESSGIWKNDYDAFFTRRCRALSRKLEQRIIRQDIDRRGQAAAPIEDDDLELGQV
jgi:hypothetical protein